MSDVETYVEPAPPTNAEQLANAVVHLPFAYRPWSWRPWSYNTNETEPSQFVLHYFNVPQPHSVVHDVFEHKRTKAEMELLVAQLNFATARVLLSERERLRYLMDLHPFSLSVNTPPKNPTD